MRDALDEKDNPYETNKTSEGNILFTTCFFVQYADGVCAVCRLPFVFPLEQLGLVCSWFRQTRVAAVAHWLLPFRHIGYSLHQRTVCAIALAAFAL